MNIQAVMTEAKALGELAAGVVIYAESEHMLVTQEHTETHITCVNLRTGAIRKLKRNAPVNVFPNAALYLGDPI